MLNTRGGKKKTANTIAFRDGLTCCIKLYRASIYDLTARAASPPHRTLSDPISTCNHTMTANRGSTLSRYSFTMLFITLSYFSLYRQRELALLHFIVLCFAFCAVNKMFLLYYMYLYLEIHYIYLYLS